MPNWASCALVVEDQEVLAKIAALPKDEDGNIKRLFNAFVPMPEELRTVSTGFTEIDGKTVRLWFETPEGNVAVSDEIRAEWREKFGADNWYDWAIQNWGTKWDASGARLSGDTIHFDSAWSPPQEFVRVLSDLYPDTEFVIGWCESGIGGWGEIHYHDGMLIEEIYNEGVYQEGADEDDEDDDFPMVTEECQEHLDKFGLHTGG